MRPESAADNTVDSQSKSAKLSGSRDLSVARAGSGHVPQAQKQAHLLVNDASDRESWRQPGLSIVSRLLRLACDRASVSLRFPLCAFASWLC